MSVLAVTVEGDGEGCLVVSWATDDRHPVDIAVGPTPEAIDHAHALHAAPGRTSARLTGLGPGRHYVSVSPAGEGGAVVAAERLVPLEGALNFRDLGGYPVVGGGHTRWGTVFRSAGLHQLTLADRVALERLGLRVVYDLRRPDERERDPSGLPAEVRAVPLSLMTGNPRPLGPDGEQFLRDLYASILVESPHHIVSLLTGLTEPESLPALFHCAAGKDRTGITAALLLTLVGVPDEHVVDDYALTAGYLGELPADVAARLLEEGWPPESLAGAGSSAPHLMVETIESLRDRHGSVERFLVEAGGMDPALPAELRRLLVATG